MSQSIVSSSSSWTSTICIDRFSANFGQDWTILQMEAAILKESHKSAESVEACSVLHTEALERFAEGWCCIVKWKDIKDNPPPQLKIWPIAAIPHKSLLFWMILDLSYKLGQIL